MNPTKPPETRAYNLSAQSAGQPRTATTVNCPPSPPLYKSGQGETPRTEPTAGCVRDGGRESATAAIAVESPPHLTVGQTAAVRGPDSLASVVTGNHVATIASRFRCREHPDWPVTANGAGCAICEREALARTPHQRTLRRRAQRKVAKAVGRVG